MTAPELQARLTVASAALADYRREVLAGLGTGPAPDWASWSHRLAVELSSICTGLRGALSMLDDADAVMDEQDHSGLLGTGGLSIAPEDARTVTSALADAASYRAGKGRQHDQADVIAYRALARVLGAGAGR